RNLLSVAEGKLEAFNQRWEESLRALIRASRPAVPVEAAPDSQKRVRRDARIQKTDSGARPAAR
ncbi:MAG TPA: hypothetical protein VK419_04210, partial [Bryobacteraceae bacterium]|nr:hypothetical protein [Bryobacteraceae bacterium]